MSFDCVPPLPLDTREEISDLSNADLDESLHPTGTLALFLASDIPLDCPTSAGSDSDPIPPFPMEVFEHIIDQCDDFDGSLCCLSLTCQAFLPRACLNLFFRIHIGHKEKLESAPTFLESRP